VTGPVEGLVADAEVTRGGFTLRAAVTAARKVSAVRSWASVRSRQRDSKYPWTLGNAVS